MYQLVQIILEEYRFNFDLSKVSEVVVSYEGEATHSTVEAVKHRWEYTMGVDLKPLADRKNWDAVAKELAEFCWVGSKATITVTIYADRNPNGLTKAEVGTHQVYSKTFKTRPK